MAYQVTIYTPAEREKLRNGSSFSDDPSQWASYSPAKHKVGPFGGEYVRPACLWFSIQRAEGNLTTQSEWVYCLAMAIKHCRRDDGAARGMTKEEFMSTLSYEPVKQEAGRVAELWKIPFADALKQCRKAWNCDWRITEATPKVPIRGGRRRGMKAAELRGILMHLGWG